MKLIELLVKELPHRGGWPEEAKIMSQDAAGMINAHRNERLVFLMDQFWTGTSKSDVCKNFLRFYLKKATDWNTNTVTREQYESALAASKAVAGHDGWIQWAGGECPVDSDAIVEVKYRNPSRNKYNNDRAGDFTWSHDGFDGDIIAYRLQHPGFKSRANDDRLERDLNECIGASEAQEWNGDGVPPIGCSCEMQDSKGTWLPVDIIAKNDGFTFGWSYDYRLVFFGDKADEFRPLRTEAERKREAAAKEMARHANSDQRRKFNAGLRNCLSIYDAIAAGKIPGVKLEENNGF